MNTYKVMPYPDYMRAKIDNVETYRADNIDNLRRNLAKKYKGTIPPILTILTENYHAIGDFSIGYKGALKWRGAVNDGNTWYAVDPATGKIKRRY